MMSSEVPPKSWHIYVSGVEIEKLSNAAQRKVLEKALSGLVKVFDIESNNISVINALISEELFDSREVSDLLDRKLPLWDWGNRFVGIHIINADIGKSLTTLCNLDLRNYRTKFHTVLKGIEGVVIRLEENTVSNTTPLLNTTGNQTETRNQSQISPAISIRSYFRHLGQQICNTSLKMKVIGGVASFFALVVLCPVVITQLNNHAVRQTDLDKNSSSVAAADTATQLNFSGEDQPFVTSTAAQTLDSSPLNFNATNGTFPNDGIIENIPAAITINIKPSNKPATPSPEKRTLGDSLGSRSGTDSVGDILQVQQVYVYRPIEFQDKIEMICDPNYNTSMVINAIDPYEWQDFQISCGSRIGNLTIQGHLEIPTVHKVLEQTRKVTHLHLNGSDLCKRSERSRSGVLDTLGVIVLSRLKSLTIYGIRDEDSHCSDLLHMLVKKVQYPKLKHLDIRDSVVSEANKLEFTRLAYKAQNTLRLLHFTEIDLQTAIFDLNFPKLYLDVFHFYTKNATSDLGAYSIVNFLSKVKSVNEFHSNIIIPEAKVQIGPILQNLARKGVKDLHMTIGLPDDRQHLSLDN